MYKSLCICGGGNLGTVIAGVALSKGYKVNLLTGHPESWRKEITVTDEFGKKYSGVLSEISNDPSKVIPGSDIVLYCLPGTVIEKYNELIKPWIIPEIPLGSVFCSTGFFPLAQNQLGENQALFGTQRVPFICRTVRYGHSAEILSYKEEVRLAVSNVPDVNNLISFLQDIFLSRIKILSSPLAVTLTNSNPLLHSARLYNLFNGYKEGVKYDRNPLFYGEWNRETSELLIKMDEEFQNLINFLGVPEGEIPPLLEYYKSTNSEELTRKIGSIKSWHNLLSPMEKIDGMWTPDLKSRYFQEEFKYSLKLIYDIAKANSIPVPTIEMVYNWGNGFINAGIGSK